MPSGAKPEAEAAPEAVAAEGPGSPRKKASWEAERPAEPGSEVEGPRVLEGETSRGILTSPNVIRGLGGSRLVGVRAWPFGPGSSSGSDDPWPQSPSPCESVEEGPTVSASAILGVGMSDRVDSPPTDSGPRPPCLRPPSFCGTTGSTLVQRASAMASGSGGSAAPEAVAEEGPASGGPVAAEGPASGGPVTVGVACGGSGRAKVSGRLVLHPLLRQVKARVRHHHNNWTRHGTWNMPQQLEATTLRQ